MRGPPSQGAEFAAPGQAPANGGNLGPERLGPIVPDARSPQDQVDLYKELGGKGKRLFGPFNPWMLSPLLGRGQYRMVGHIHSGKLGISLQMVSFVILYTVRLARARFALQQHVRIARSRGLPDALIEDLRMQRRPAQMTSEQDAAYDLIAESWKNLGAAGGDYWGVSDPTYEKAVKVLGEQGVGEVLSVTGVYGAVGMVLNTFRVGIVGEDVMPPLSSKI